MQTQKIILLLAFLTSLTFAGEIKVSCKNGTLTTIKEVKKGIYCIVSKKAIKGTLKIPTQKGVFYSIVCKQP